MNFDKGLLIELKSRLRDEAPGRALPGWDAQQRMATEVHRRARLQPRADARRAAVLMLLYPRAERLYLPMIVRPSYPGVHSGQIALPGGKVEPEDSSLVATALRETEEEIGVRVPKAQIIGVLSELYIPPSNFIVTPVLAYTLAAPIYRPEPREVARVLDFPLAAFAEPDNVSTVSVKAMRGITLEAPCYIIGGHTVWGATAMMMSELLAVLERDI
jgi:8-oxo-dGTP pyrophosphatase MutT (NUDIX family)